MGINSEIVALDFIRFEAALLVSVFHFAFRPAVHPDSPLHALLPAAPDFRMGIYSPGLVGSALD
jgi:peptidoglycan/LPS O-acetylase OafA/YrhL